MIIIFIQHGKRILQTALKINLDSSVHTGIQLNLIIQLAGCLSIANVASGKKLCMLGVAIVVCHAIP